MRFLYHYLRSFLAIQHSSTARLYLPSLPDLCYSPDQAQHYHIPCVHVDGRLHSLDKTHGWSQTAMFYVGDSNETLKCLLIY
jgi:hypothetical protein